jgi:hypothetical protein
MTLTLFWRRVAVVAFTLASLAIVLYTLGAPYELGG